MGQHGPAPLPSSFLYPEMPGPMQALPTHLCGHVPCCSQSPGGCCAAWPGSPCLQRVLCQRQVGPHHRPSPWVAQTPRTLREAETGCRDWTQSPRSPTCGRWVPQRLRGSQWQHGVREQGAPQVLHGEAEALSVLMPGPAVLALPLVSALFCPPDTSPEPLSWTQALCPPARSRGRGPGQENCKPPS